MTLEPAIQILLGLLAASALMTGLWLVQRRTHNAGIADVGWAAGIGLLGVIFAATSDGYLPRRILVAVLIGAWSARLAAYLLLDRVLGRPEDGRYASMRRRWGAAAERELFRYFQYQALFAVFFSLPVLVVTHHQLEGWSGWDLAGALIWCRRRRQHDLADRQLARFGRAADNRGKTCRDGWWRYSRHPNYFFEWLHWWSYVVLARRALVLVGHAAGAGGDALLPAQRDGHPADRGAGARQPRRRLPLVPAHDQRVLPWFPGGIPHRVDPCHRPVLRARPAALRLPGLVSSICTSPITRSRKPPSQ